MKEIGRFLCEILASSDDLVKDYSRNNCALDLSRLGIRERSELVSYSKQMSVVRAVGEKNGGEKSVVRSDSV